MKKTMKQSPRLKKNPCGEVKPRSAFLAASSRSRELTVRMTMQPRYENTTFFWLTPPTRWLLISHHGSSDTLGRPRTRRLHHRIHPQR